jgi:hypothetical protein
MLSYTEHGKFLAPTQAANPLRRGNFYAVPPAEWIMGRERAQWLEHDPEKWIRVFRTDHAPTLNLDLDPIQSNWIKV